jgi:hypothetical protein
MSDRGEDRSVEIDEEEQTDEESDTEAIDMLRYDLLQTAMELPLTGNDDANGRDANS